MSKVVTKLMSVIFFLIVSFTSTHVLAVDGYKEMKFGMSLNEILARTDCSFKEEESDLPGLQSIVCDDFKFGGSKVPSAMYLVNGQFLRIAIEPPVELVDGILAGLMKKYGDPSFKSPEEDFKAVDQYANRKAELGWDNGTVFLQFYSDQLSNQGLLLLYTSPEFDKQMLLNQEQSFGDDL